MGLFNFVKHGKNSKSSANSSDSASRPDYSKLPIEQQLIRYIDCPYKLIPQNTPISEVNKEYTAALRYGAERGCTPVIIPVTQNLVNLLGRDGEMNADIGLIRELRRALLWQINDSAGDIIIESAYYERISELAVRGIDTSALENGNAQGASVNAFHSFAADGRTTCAVILAQLPTVNPWEVFVWLPVGGVNGAPADNELICISRLWNEMCGAIPSVIGFGVIEYFIPRGKPDQNTATEIAKGHFAVCPDRVLRMTRSRTIGELADTLTKSCVWYLGWKGEN
ncbi:MAG: DUF4253 domain-containing protein [Acutalibacteraceae bacterium]